MGHIPPPPPKPDPRITPRSYAYGMPESDFHISLPTGFRFYLIGWGFTALMLIVLAKAGGLI